MKPAVLIVDDSLTVRMDLSDTLALAGFPTTHCANLAEARRALAGKSFALVILDVILPDGDGIEFLAEIKRTPATAATRVLLLSSEAEVRARIRGLQTGADEYVGKPYDQSYIVARALELVQPQERATGDARTTILVIDDSLTFRANLALALEAAGYTVVTAATGEDGLRLAVDAHPTAIVVDGVLPGIDGATVISRIRTDAALRRTPCILLTSSEDHGGELRALDAGADAYVRKDDGTEVILARVTASLRSSQAPTAIGLTTGLLGPKKILVVDDSLTYLHEASSNLRQEGYDLIMARSGEEALQVLQVQRVDCILLDMVMPGLSGHETSRRIKASPLWRDIPLIIQTAHDELSAMVDSINAGADDYIAKTCDQEVLRARVRAQLRRKHFEDENRNVHERLITKEREVAAAHTARELAEARAAFVGELERKNIELEAFSVQLLSANETLRLAKEAKEALLAAYERSERVSTLFQEAALPEKLPTVPGFVFDAHYRPGPSDSVLGGDWYDVLRLADGRLIFSIGDVGGSGLRATIIMATIRQVIRGVAYIHADPVMILDAAGKALRAERPDIYVTAFVGLIDPVAMTLTYASAGHPPPLLRYPDGRLEELLYDGILLGLPPRAGHVPTQIALPANSFLVLYTDGLIEATGDIAAGENKLRTAVCDRTVTAGPNTARAIHDAVLPQGARDDVALLTVTVLPSPFHTGDAGNGDVSHWTFDAANATAAQCARADFAEQLRARDALQEDVYAAEIVFGELVGNVVRHAEGEIEAFVDWNGPAPVLHIRDHGPGFVHAPRLPPDLLAEGGRGLYIISALTADFNVTRIAGKGSHARAVITLSRNELWYSDTPKPLAHALSV